MYLVEFLTKSDELVPDLFVARILLAHQRHMDDMLEIWVNNLSCVRPGA